MSVSNEQLVADLRDEACRYRDRERRRHPNRRRNPAAWGIDASRAVDGRFQPRDSQITSDLEFRRSGIDFQKPVEYECNMLLPCNIPPDEFMELTFERPILMSQIKIEGTLHPRRTIRVYVRNTNGDRVCLGPEKNGTEVWKSGLANHGFIDRIRIFSKEETIQSDARCTNLIERIEVCRYDLPFIRNTFEEAFRGMGEMFQDAIRSIKEAVCSFARGVPSIPEVPEEIRVEITRAAMEFLPREHDDLVSHLIHGPGGASGSVAELGPGNVIDFGRIQQNVPHARTLVSSYTVPAGARLVLDPNTRPESFIDGPSNTIIEVVVKKRTGEISFVPRGRDDRSLSLGMIVVEPGEEIQVYIQSDEALNVRNARIRIATVREADE